MHKYEKFLFFYSTLATTIFLFAYGIFQPRPINFLTGILMLPVVFYFWIRMTNPEKSDPVYWSTRFVFLLFIFISFGVGVYFMAMKNVSFPWLANTNDTEEISELKKKIATLTDEVNSIDVPLPTENPSPSPVLGDQTSNIADLVTPKIVLIGNMELDIYDEPEAGAKVVGSLLPGINYLYTEKKLDWYKVLLSEYSSGWIDGRLVREIN